MNTEKSLNSVLREALRSPGKDDSLGDWYLLADEAGNLIAYNHATEQRTVLVYREEA